MLRRMSESKIYKSKYKGKSKTIKDAFEKYLLTIEDESPVSREEFIEINRAFNRLIMNKLLDNHKVYLPGNLGMVHVFGNKEKVKFDEGNKVKGLAPNWRQTKELWAQNPKAKENKQVVYNTNEHSSGIRYRFVWSKTNCKIPNKTLYTLRMTREYKRKLSAQIFKGKEYDSKI